MDSNIYVISRLGASQQDSHKVCAGNGSWSLSGNDKVLVIQLPVGLSACLSVCLRFFMGVYTYMVFIHMHACMHVLARKHTRGHAGMYICTSRSVGSYISDYIKKSPLYCKFSVF